MAKQGRITNTGGSGRRLTRGNGGAADWSTVDADTLQQTIVAVSMAGGAIRFGYTGDGGAYAIGIYGDGDKPYTEYLRPGENVEAFLVDVQTTFGDIEAERRAKAK